MSRASLALPACLAGVTVGVLLADPAQAPPPLLDAIIGGGLLTALVALVAGMAGRRGRPHGVGGATVVAAIGVGLALGAWRGAAASLPTGPGSVAVYVAGTGRTAGVAVQGSVVDDPRPREDRQQIVLDAVVIDGRPARGRIVAWLPRALEIGSGDVVAFSAQLEAPQDFDGFAYRAFLARQGIGAIGRAFDARIAHPTAASPSRVLAGARAALLGGLDAIVPEPEAALGAGILLGVRTAIDPAVNTAFATAGLTHVVAISGWNIAIVAALVARLLEGVAARAGGRLLVPGLTLAAIGGYVVLVGSSPSVVRAALMAAAMLLGRQAGSRAHAASALMLAALVMLVIAPAVLWDVGFQLSLLATAGLIAFGASFAARLEAWPGWIREPVALTLAAQLTTLPVILLTFERLSLVAPLANVLVTPMVPLVMLACAIAAPVGMVAGAVPVPPLTDAAGWLAGGAAWLGLRAMIATGTAVASIPFASLPVSMPAALALGWYPALAIAWRIRHRTPRASASEPVGLEGPGIGRRLRRAVGRALGVVMAPARIAAHAVATPRRSLCALIIVLGVTTLATLPDGRLHLVMLDIGQGDAVLVVAPSGAAMLIDGGPDPDVTLRRLGSALPWWRRSIDIVLLTHPHQDHVGGLPEVLRRFRVGTVLDGGRAYSNPAYAQLLALAAVKPGATYQLARAGARVRLDAHTTLTLLYPSETDAAGPLPAGDINNASVVGLLRFGRFGALLTGDAEAPVEALLAERDALTRVDVLKVGHHGSRSGTTPAFVAALHPTVGLISVGADNEYGHPSPDTLRVLADAGVSVLRTDLDGTVEVRTDGATWSVVARGRAGPPHPARSSTLPDPAAAVSLRRPFGTRGGEPGSIATWQFPIARRRRGSWPHAGCRRASSGTRRASPASRLPPRGWSRRRESPSTWPWSRPPPSSTTSTSR